MTRVQRHRDAMRPHGRPYSLVAYVLHAAARTLAEHPEANAAVRGRLRPRVARYPGVSGKLALDKTLDGQRVVLAAVLPGLERSTLAGIQRRIDHFRDGDPAVMPEFAGARALHRLPAPLGALLYRLGVRPLRRRAEVFGTFAVSSLGHRPVDGFHSVGGTTVTLGLGQVAERPAVRDGRLTTAPLMRLSLTFDHRVIDGAEAADVLTGVKERLEEFTPEPDDGPDDDPSGLSAAREAVTP
ncbi:acyltransferase [Streptomyces armeniacus]|uniref:Dihydrolipoyllysine-residue succinyltransferase component of 2-oxoglutarate dehydrogenase complex n=1 Tax=Streptomyces armeniacus TaxID=83291 RepID=A0A345XLA8_9ACTN|nr:2-oxo acid dehydrogenase subunit E2 [Streptomyces armeniacus]AXK32424.1 acyltransferase [Streptomyces armeniacus]